MFSLGYKAMQGLFLRLWVVVAALLASGCVTKPNARAIRKVKSVAIIGFVVVPQHEVSLKNIDNTFQTAGRLYRLVSQGLGAERKWKMTTPETLAKSHTYGALFSRYGAHVLSNDLRASGVLSAEEQVNLNPHERDNLRKILNVDGLVSISFVMAQRQALPSDPPDAPRYTAKVTFDLYAGNGGGSVWHVSSLPNDKLHNPTLPPAFNFTADEKDLASAIFLSLATMLQERRASEAAKS